MKGKALADAKLLKEYNVQNGDTINFMVKLGVDWDPTKAPEPPAPLAAATPEEIPAPAEIPPPEILASAPDTVWDWETASWCTSPPASRRSHSRIPSVVLSPTPSSPLQKPQDIQLVDADGFMLPAKIPTEPAAPQSTYRTTVSQPAYWERLLAFLRFAAEPYWLMLLRKKKTGPD